MGAKPQQMIADRDFERILFIRLSALGDVVQSVALINALRTRYPNARIDWLLKPSPATLVQHLPSISNVLVYGANHTEAPQYNWDGVKHYMRLLRDSSFRRLLSSIRATKYDLVIDIQGQMRTGIVAALTGAPVRIGFERARRENTTNTGGAGGSEGTVKRAWKGSREGSWLAYTHHVPVQTSNAHAVDGYLSFGRLLGFDPSTVDFTFPIPREADEAITRRLSDEIGSAAAPIVISPAALWETKKWHMDGFSAVAKHFAAKGHPVILIGSADETALCAGIAAGVQGVFNWAGSTTLPQLGALIQRARLCLTNDSGPMHMAVALGRPVVSIFGPSDPVWAGPYRREGAVLQADLPCTPCRIRKEKDCPHNHACMHQITAHEVIVRMKQALLAEPHAPAIP